MLRKSRLTAGASCNIIIIFEAVKGVMSVDGCTNLTKWMSRKTRRLVAVLIFNIAQIRVT